MPSVKISGTTEFKDYHFTVKGRSALGTGFPMTTGPHQFNFNIATGGDITIDPDYNGSGEEWTIHSFDAGSHTFTVERSIEPFRVLVIGGGGSGRYREPGWSGGGGKAGGEFLKTIPVGDHPVSVGGGSPADGGGSNPTNGHPSSFLDITSAGGNVGRNDGNGGGGWQTESDIHGSKRMYGYNPPRYYYSTNGPGSGGGGGKIAANWGYGGAAGIVIIAYRTG